ncbi:MAG: S26 family signal peptidase [Pirellulaceae bacterium]|nr:S26 family signal peptidase [Pirellulaceae bacterium]
MSRSFWVNHPDRTRRSLLRAAAATVTVSPLLGCRKAELEPTLSSIRGRVTSHSMAPHLLGPHVVWECSTCGWEIPMVWESGLDKDFVCPQCGVRQYSEVVPQPVLGDRVDFVLGEKEWEPDRFDVVVVEASGPGKETEVNALPGGDEQRLVKRIIGLPGESLAFRHGDLYIDDRLTRKSWNQQLQQSVLVHGDFWKKNLQAKVGWRADTGAVWTRDMDRWFSQSQSGTKSGRLVYHHRRCVVTPSGDVPSAPIEDTLAYSQSQPRRLNPVNDLMLRGQWRMADNSRLTCSLASGDRIVSVIWDLDQQRVMTQVPGQLDFVSKKIHLPQREWAHFGVSCFDRRLTVELQGVVIVEEDFVDKNYTNKRSGYSTEPIVLEAGGEVEVQGLEIRRDLHLVGPYGDETQWELGRKLGEDEYFLIGDNLPESADSRISRRGVSRRQLLARLDP